MAFKSKKDCMKKDLLKKMVSGKKKDGKLKVPSDPLSGNGSNLGTNGIF